MKLLTLIMYNMAAAIELFILYAAAQRHNPEHQWTNTVVPICERYVRVPPTVIPKKRPAPNMQIDSN